MPEPLTVWIEILSSLHRDPIRSSIHEGLRVWQSDRKVRGRYCIRQIEECRDHHPGQVICAIAVKINVERRCWATSIGIFTHYAYSCDENAETRPGVR